MCRKLVEVVENYSYFVLQLEQSFWNCTHIRCHEQKHEGLLSQTRDFTDEEVVSPCVIHQCCDVCVLVCACDECSRMDEETDAAQIDLCEPPGQSLPQLPPHKCRELYKRLEEYRNSAHLTT